MNTTRAVPDLVTDFRTDGFAFHPSLLSGTEAQLLTTETERLLRGEHLPERFLHEKDGATVRTVVNPHLYSDVFDRLIRHPKLLAAARELLDDDVYVFQMGVNNKASFNGDVWFWHQDYPGYYHDDHIPTSRMVNTLIFLDDVNTMNGPLMMVPGSSATCRNGQKYPTRARRIRSAMPMSRRSPTLSPPAASPHQPDRPVRSSSCTSTPFTDRRPTSRRGRAA